MEKQFPGNADDPIEVAPVAFVVLDGDHRIVRMNRRGRELLRSDVDDNFRSLIHPGVVERYEALWTGSQAGAETVYLQLLTEDKTKYVEFTGVRHSDGHLHAWIVDLSEARALRAQLQRQKKPGRRFLHDLSASITTMLGHTELIQMLLRAGEAISGEMLSNLQRYAGDLGTELKRIESLVADEKAGHTTLKSSRVMPVHRRHVLIVDDEPGVAKFLAELMRGRQYKVTAFNDAYAALDYFIENSSAIDLAILDHTMPGITGIGLATEMLAQAPGLPVMLCTGDERVIDDQLNGNINIKYFIRKPIDINELMQTVMEILETK